MRIHLVTLAFCGVLTVTAPGFAFDGLTGQEQTAASKATVNLNTATIEQLTTLPGVGRKTAELIVEYRTKSGGFKKIEELMNIKGIGEKTFLKLKPLVSAPPKTDKTGA